MRKSLHHLQPNRAATLRLCGIAGLAIGILGTSTASAQTARERDNDQPERRSSLDQRGPVRNNNNNNNNQHDGDKGDEPGGTARFPTDVRTIDGSNNNPAHAAWGAAGTEMIRIAPAYYADGIDDPAGANRPSARTVSNALCAASGITVNEINASGFLWQWGQFLDHDIDETPVTEFDEPFDILVPAGDPWFDPFNTGTVVIPLDRSAGDYTSGVRQQFNNLTAFIDASNVYGSEDELAHWLRTNDGTGRMKTSEGDLLPYNTDGFHNAPSSDDPTYFLGGDIRANEQVGLTAMHTLFIREHNYWADRIAADNPDYTGDEIYEHARAIVAGEMQAITYREFLPLLLGPHALPPYRGWQPDVNPSIANEFATAAYRVGHTMLNATLYRLDANGNEISAGHLSLADGFFNPTEISEHGIDSLLRGLAKQPAQAIDTEITDEVRNFLFGPPGAGGFDQPALNMQRGRDHGLSSYNQLRVAVGLPAISSFEQLPTDDVTRQRYASVYSSVDDIDAWIGMLGENHRPGALVGETMYRVLRDQFTRLRDGDRFWYESYLPRDMVRLVERQTLDVIIRRNTDIGGELQENAFLIQPECVADVNHDGVLTPADFSAWVSAFNEQEPECDQNQDGQCTAADYAAWVANYNAGC